MLKYIEEWTGMSVAKVKKTLEEEGDKNTKEPVEQIMDFSLAGPVYMWRCFTT